METVTDFIFLGSKITVDHNCNLAIERCSLEEELWQTFLLFSRSVVNACSPMNWSTPGFPGFTVSPELAQTHVSDAIQPSHSLPFSSCLQSFPASGSFQMSQFFASGGQSIGVSASASALPMNIQDWICYNVASLRESFFKNNFILAVLVFHWCTRAFFSCGGQGLLSSSSAWASHCSGFSCCRAQALGCVTCSSCGSQTLEHRLSSSDTALPGPGIKLVSPALASIFFTTEPPRKPTSVFYVFFDPCVIWDLNSPTGDWTHIPCTERQNLNQWTARKVPF